MAKTRTIIVAVALTIPELYDIVPEPSYDAGDLEDFINEFAHEVSVVGVYDRDRPINNLNPELFSAYGPDFTEGMNEVVPETVPAQGRMPNCDGLSTNKESGHDEAPEGYW